MQSWWAILIYVVLFLTLIYAAFRFTRYRLRMEHEIRISHLEQQQIEELNRVKLQFFTNVTHELMTPLSILLTSLEGLNNGIGERRTLYSIMTVNATRLMRLIQQILEFRKAESGNLKLRVSRGNLTAFVRKCGEAFKPLVDKKELTFSFDSDPERIDTQISGVKVFDAAEIVKLVRRLNVLIGIVAVPKSAAQEVADKLVEGGVRAIWNFAPVHLNVPENIAVKNEDMAASLAILSKRLAEILYSEK